MSDEFSISVENTEALKKKLPLGISSFEAIRKQRICYYVDKTPHIVKLLELRDNAPTVFLSRPRRFGKTLLLDTIQCLFEGKKELFEGLYIYDKWDWDETAPVIRIDLIAGAKTPEDFNEKIIDRLHDISLSYGLEISKNFFPDFLERLIIGLHRKTNKQVVLLIDEYDSPFAEFWTNDVAIQEIQLMLRNLFAVIKYAHKQLAFTLITGVTRIQNMQLFSAVNNLFDITLEPTFNAICGYTEEELVETFAPELVEDPKTPFFTLENLRYWYNGYNWLGETTVYNPYDILYAFHERKTRPHWFRFGTPQLLYHFLSNLSLFELYQIEERVYTFSALSQSLALGEESQIDLFLFQSGYLTNKRLKHDPMKEEEYYVLGFPNNEVKSAFSGLQLEILLKSKKKTESFCNELLESIRTIDLTALRGVLEKYLSKLIYSQVQEYSEKYERKKFKEAEFSRLIYMALLAAGVRYVEAEVHTLKGRIDLLAIHDNVYFVFEFKGLDNASEEIPNKPLNTALVQANTMEYGNRYVHEGRVFHIGIEFDRRDLQMLDMRWEELPSDCIPVVVEEGK